MGTLWFPILMVALIGVAFWVIPNYMSRVRRRSFWAGVLVLAGLVLGLLIVAVTAIIGLSVDDVATARQWIGLGLVVGLGILVPAGIPAAVVIDALGYIFLATPRERIARVLRAYSSFLAWLIVVEEALYILGVYAPANARFIGLVAGLVIGLMAFAWDYGVNWGRPLAFNFQVVLVVWAIAVSIPSGVWIKSVGWDVRSALSFPGVVEIDQRELDETREMDSKKKRERNIVRLQEIRRELVHARSDEEYRDARAKLERWENEEAGGIRRLAK